MTNTENSPSSPLSVPLAPPAVPAPPAPPAALAAPAALAPLAPHAPSYIPTDTGHYWFELIPELCLNTKEKYNNWCKPMSDSIHSGWAAHCREEITAEQYNTFASATNTWLKKYNEIYK